MDARNTANTKDETMLYPVKLRWTIWKFTAPTSGETKIVARCSEPMEIEHEYQRVLTRVDAYNEREALEISGYERK